MKIAILILSDPASGNQEALARAYNGCALAYECKQKGDDVVVLFIGTASRWPIEMEKKECPIHSLYMNIKDKVIGVSKECAIVFGVKKSLDDLDYQFLGVNKLPDTNGLVSIRTLIEEGYLINTF